MNVKTNIAGFFKLPLLLVLSLVSPLSFAIDTPVSVNLSDKTDSYDLGALGEKTGKVIVKTKFVEEPMISPLQIEVIVRCAEGFKQNKLSKPQIWQAFDYGTLKDRKLLSHFSNSSQELVVYYWDAKIDSEEGQASHDHMLSKIFSLKDACRKKY